MYKREPFQKVWEHYMSRYTAAAFCIGDIIQFDEKVFADESFKELPADAAEIAKNMIEEQIKGDAILTVANISLSPLDSDHAIPSTVTIAYSLGGGRYYQPVTIPGTLMRYARRVEDDKIIPDKFKINYDKKYDKKPKPAKLEHIEIKNGQ